MVLYGYSEFGIELQPLVVQHQLDSKQHETRQETRKSRISKWMWVQGRNGGSVNVNVCLG